MKLHITTKPINTSQKVARISTLSVATLCIKHGDGQKAAICQTSSQIFILAIMNKKDCPG